ncbi:MAG: response regulator transcription factor [Proteobacteria bacterium]|jgi:DNA-binding NarL/FixJ family response regulator|nr:response regulator transcription factor [Ramlibacter sp.]MCA0214341.1 response regulator transcription factor [Pseudomonadota bacterium]
MPPSRTAAAPQAPVTVALVEDDPGTRSRFEAVIHANPQLALAHSAAWARDMLAWLAANPVDVLLVDLGLPDGSGIDVIRECTRLQPACEVMVITMFGDEANMMKAFGAGAKGYLLKDGTGEDLAAHIMNLRNGGSPMSPIIARKLLGKLGGAMPAQPAPGPALQAACEPAAGQQPLSPKETEVLSLVARGFSYGEAAGLLNISVHTVHSHVRNIYGKLSVSSKTEAVYEARQLGLLRN